jgi:signal transduction histidine kinase
MMGVTETAPRLTAEDLAELMDTVQSVTLRLQSSHDQLTSEVHRLKRELNEANDALERSRRLAALGEMAAGIAHEIRNPLAAISLDAASLFSTGNDPDQREAAARIGRSVRSLNAIVQDVLHFAADTPVRIERQDVQALVARVMEASAGVVDCEVRVELGPWELQTVDADEHLLQRALVNVVRNALEAMAESPAPSGGHTLGVRVVLGQDGETELVISDTGPGIPQTVIERMFNPFFTTRATGTGLGLAIVHRILDAHGGRVVVNGKRTGSCGAEVRLVLPRHDAAVNAEAA